MQVRLKRISIKTKGEYISKLIFFPMLMFLVCGSFAACAIKDEEQYTKSTESTWLNSVQELSQEIETAQEIEDKIIMKSDNNFHIIGEVEETEDRKIVYEMAKSITEAYFQGDIETIKKYIEPDYEGTLETYLDGEKVKSYNTDSVMIYGITGLSDIEGEMNRSYTVQVEFLPVDDDSKMYLFMTFEKSKDKWQITSYGLEK